MCYGMGCAYEMTYIGTCNVKGGYSDGACQSTQCEVCTRSFSDKDDTMTEVCGTILCQECAKDFLEAMEEE